MNPTYTSLGDHMESIQVDYDPAVISYARLLEEFRRGHRPFAASWSRQYASAIFFHDEEQKKEALAAKQRWEKERHGALKSEIVPLDTFYLAEDYHQKYRLRKDALFFRAFMRLHPRKTNQAVMNSTVAARLNGYLQGHGDLGALSRELTGLGLTPPEQKQLWAIVKGNHPSEGVTCPIPEG